MTSRTRYARETTAGNRQTDVEFGLVQEAGCYGMLACAAAAAGLVSVAGAYTLCTGEPLQVPLLPLVVGWFVLLGVFEFMAFGWLIFRPLPYAFAGALLALGAFHVVEWLS